MVKTSLLARIIFGSRWLQAPLYFGLLVALIVYVYRFGLDLIELVVHVSSSDNNTLMLTVLNLIDVVMIANLLIMVIVGGYDTFVSRLHIKNHRDHPDWLDEVNAGSMKIKLAIALVAISSIHLLRTFIDPTHYTNDAIKWQVVIHLTLVISALALAYATRMMGYGGTNHNKERRLFDEE
jgi:uncharacterized protein (TIGR00645 family)